MEDEQFDGGSIAALIELSELRHSLMLNLQTLLAESKYKETLQEYPYTETPKEDLLVQAAAAEEELKKVFNATAIRDNVIKSLLYGQEANKAAIPGFFQQDTDDTENSNPLRENIKSRFEALHMLSGKLLEKFKSVNALEEKLQESMKKLQEIEHKNRELCIMLQHAEKNNSVALQRRKAEEEDKRTSELKEALENSVKGLKLRRETFQGLIQASKVNWFSDPELREFTLSFGESNDIL